MQTVTRAIVAVIVAALLLSTASARESYDPKYPVGPGETGIVACKDKPNESYEIYLPKTYSPYTPHPILITFAAQGGGFVSQFRSLAKARDMIVVGMIESRNSISIEQIITSVDPTMRDLRQRVNYDPTALFVGGMSGGSVVSAEATKWYRPHVAGVLAMGPWLQGFRRPIDRYLPGLVWARTIGTTDTARYHAPADRAHLESFGVVVEDFWFEGGHTLPPQDVKEEAIDWLLDNRVKPGPFDFHLAAMQEITWRQMIDDGQKPQVVQECMDAITSSPRTYMSHHAQIVLDSLLGQPGFITSQPWLGLANDDYATDYFYFNAWQAGLTNRIKRYENCRWLYDRVAGPGRDRNPYVRFLDGQMSACRIQVVSMDLISQDDYTFRQHGWLRIGSGENIRRPFYHRFGEKNRRIENSILVYNDGAPLLWVDYIPSDHPPHVDAGIGKLLAGGVFTTNDATTGAQGIRVNLFNLPMGHYWIRLYHHSSYSKGQLGHADILVKDGDAGSDIWLYKANVHISSKNFPDDHPYTDLYLRKGTGKMSILLVSIQGGDSVEQWINGYEVYKYKPGGRSMSFY